MHELILHHYPNSPFAEKARLMLGFKGLSWTSVMVPSLMPKPDVVALTGGYRRTPFLQVGADVYCDTALIARVLEARAPEPSLFPATAPLAPALATWADSSLFWCCVAWAMQPAGAAAILGGNDPAALKAFATDRAAMAGAMQRMTLADATVQLHQHLGMLELQLQQQSAHGGWLFGPQACVADFAVAHGLWFIRLAPPVAGILTPYGAVTEWLDRVLAIGHGPGQVRMKSVDAVALAAATGGHAPAQVQPGMGLEAGQPVQVYPTDYAIDPVVGNLVGLDSHEVVVRRTDVRAGTVHVHFPRAGFQVRRQRTAAD